MNQNRNTWVLVGIIAIAVSFVVGLSVGDSGRSTAAVSDSTREQSVINPQDFEPFWRAWQVLEEKYVSAASTTQQEKIWGAISGLAASYKDPYTIFFPPAEDKMFKEDISGDFEGVGMEIGIKNKQLQVVAPIKGSPADRAGVKVGDYILEIDGKSTIDMSTDQAVKLIRGPKSTTVKILFLTQGASTPVEKPIVRDVINIPTIETSRKPGGVFVIRLFSFTAQSPDLFRNALRDFILSGDKKLILDLRGNPGGYLEAAWDIASWFLPAGKTVVIEDFGDKASPKYYRSKGYDVFNENLRMIVLVDGGSASASEILAGALAENGVAKLVGTKTFGKGSVQELVSITSDTSLKVTIAHWMTPDGHNLSESGLEPDYVVEVNEENTKDGNDPILNKALELLR